MQASQFHNVVSWEHQWNAYQRRAFGDDLGSLEWRVDSLRRSARAGASKIADKLDRCCKEPVVVAVDGGQDYYISESRCRSRVCPRCSKIRARALSVRIAELVHRMDDARFVTFTIRSNNRPLADQIKHLRRKFGAMRRTKLWGHYVKGGVYTIEVTWNDETGQWHPHLHAIVDGIYWPQHDLLNLWEGFVGDHAGVDIRIVRGVRKLANYLACYVSKSCDLAKLDGPQLADWAIATHGLRLAQTFGSLQSCKPASEVAEPTPCRLVDVDVNDLADNAACGVEAAELLLRALEPRRRKDGPEANHERAGLLFAWQHPVDAKPPPPRRPIDKQLTLNN